MRYARPITSLILFELAFGTSTSVLADRLVTTDTVQNGGTLVVNPIGALIVSDPINNPLLTLMNGAGASGIQSVTVGNLANEQGRLLIESGGTLSNSGDAILGFAGQSIGTATVTGNGSKWQNSGNLHVGYDGTGTLKIENGGRVISDSSFVGNRAAGTATVNGAGSEWLNSKLFQVFGSSSLNIENGGFVSGSGYVASGGTVTITGQGSKWQSNNVFGALGGGTMIIEKGGLATSAVGYVGDGIFRGSATCTITGPESLWQNSGDTYLGVYGVGKLIVQDGGVAEVGGLLSVGTQGTLTGNGGTIQGDVINNGLIAPGNSPGILTIDSDLTTTGIVQFELAGTGTGLFDQLIVTGELTLGGVVELDLIDGFNPTAGSSFKLLSFGSLIDSGFTFDLSHATLATNLSWDTSTFATDGTIRVVPEASSLMLAGMATFAGLFVWRKNGR